VDRHTTAVCLATTSQYPGCVSSAGSGRLDYIMLDTTRLGMVDPAWLNFETGPFRPGEGVELEYPHCSRYPTDDAATPPPLDCLSASAVPQPPRIRGNLLTVALPIVNMTWELANQKLGCFYVTSPDMYPDGQEVLVDQFKEWAFAFQFSQLPGVSSAVATLGASGTSSMGGLAFFDSVELDAPSTETACQRSTVSIRVPQGDSQGATSQVPLITLMRCAPFRSMNRSSTLDIYNIFARITYAIQITL
jgi:hypothetical protein